MSCSPNLVTEGVRASNPADMLASTPVLLLNSEEPADPLYRKYIFQP
jgi:hypothetical protein